MHAGIVKECLHYKKIPFDKETLTRRESMVKFKACTKGAPLDQLRKLRHSFKVPVDILVNLSANQATKVLARMTQERDVGGLRDVPKRSLFDVDSSSTFSRGIKIEDSPGKRKCV